MSDALADAAGITRNRPRSDGALIGHALAELVAAGKRADPDMPDPCATCAFRRGCMTNTMPATVIEAFRCATGADDAEFGCHHGMVDGMPAKRCAGWMAAQAADWPDVERIMADLTERFANFDENKLDVIRDAYDAWIARVDPGGNLDDYARGRLWLRDDPCGMLNG